MPILESEVKEPVVETPAGDPKPPAQEPGENNPSGSAETPAWTKQLKGDLKTNELLTQYKTINDAGEGLVSMTEQLSRSVVKPGEDATEEDQNKYFTELGRPESLDKYELSKIELPEGMKFGEGTEEQFKKRSFENGLTQKQTQANWEATVKDGIETYNAVVKSLNKRAEKAEESLRAEWGADYKDNIALGERAKTQFLSAEDITALEKEGNANSPTLLKLLHKVGVSISEGHFINGDPPAGDNSRKSHDGKKMLPYNM